MHTAALPQAPSPIAVMPVQWQSFLAGGVVPSFLSMMAPSIPLQTAPAASDVPVQSTQSDVATLILPRTPILVSGGLSGQVCQLRQFSQRVAKRRVAEPVELERLELVAHLVAHRVLG